MRRILPNLIVFSLGLALAALVAFRHHLHSMVSGSLRAKSLETEESIPAQITKKFQTANELGVAEIARQKLEIPYAHEKRAMLSREYSRERRAEILESAVEQGGLDSLQVIRSEYISFLPEYHSEILPRLRRVALKEMRIRFAEQDWLDWPSSAVSNGGGPTEARIFLDNMGLVNGDLGRFLETSAQLYHGMYLSVLSGNTYSVKDDLFYVLQSAEKILSNRSFPAIPARLMLDPQILSRAEFNQEIERLRCDLTALHVSRYPNELVTHLKLIEELKVSSCAETTSEVIAEVLRRLTVGSSQTYRESVIPLIIDSQTLPVFAEQDVQVRNNLAEFYVMSAVDALAVDSRERASGFLSLSESIEDGLRSQDIVRAYLKKAEAKAKAKPKKVASPKLENKEEVPLRSRFGDSLRKASTQPTSSSLGSYIVYAVLMFALLALVAVVILWLLGKRAVTRGPKIASEPESEEHPSERKPSTGGSPLDDDDFELGDFSSDDEIAHSVAAPD